MKFAVTLDAPSPADLRHGMNVRVLDETSPYYRQVGVLLRTYPQRNAHSPHRAVVALAFTGTDGVKRRTMRGFPLTALRVVP
jgi:hypothetical protein